MNKHQDPTQSIPIQRPFWASAVLALTAVFIAWGMTGGQAVAQLAQDCSVCHRSIHKDWLQSSHSKAWNSERFQAQLQQFGKKEFCGTCHAPATVWKSVDLMPGEQPTAFKAVLTNKLSFRAEVPEDGVTCTSCHVIEVVRPQGKGTDFVGPYHSTAGHAGTEVSEFTNYRLCATCHGRPPTDYLPEVAPASREFHHIEAVDFDFAFDEADCASCHMPKRQERLVQLRAFQNLPERHVGEHSFSGQRYQRLSTGLEFSLSQEGSQTVLLLTNAKIGHPLKISPDTSYRIDLSRMQGDEAVETQPVDLTEANGLGQGQTIKIPVPFQDLAPGSLRVDLYRKEGEMWQAKVFSKRL